MKITITKKTAHAIMAILEDYTRRTDEDAGYCTDPEEAWTLKRKGRRAARLWHWLNEAAKQPAP